MIDEALEELRQRVWMALHRRRGDMTRQSEAAIDAVRSFDKERGYVLLRPVKAGELKKNQQFWTWGFVYSVDEDTVSESRLLPGMPIENAFVEIEGNR